MWMERLAGESPRAYQLFRLYCELGAERSLTRVQQAYAQQTGRAVSLNTLKKWSRRFLWAERARAYDQLVQFQRERERQQIREAMMEEVLTVLQSLTAHLRQAVAHLPAQLTASEFVRLVEALRVLMELLPTPHPYAGILDASFLFDPLSHHGEELIKMEAKRNGAGVE
jgi:tRNA nucleotidyltransferase/poly(A) polymerase